MSLTSALNAGRQGATAQTTKLAQSANDMANQGAGYKGSDVQFSQLVTGQDGTGGGVQTIVRKLIDEQGLIDSTSRATDLAISGKGFFAVEDEGGNLLFTRAGNFTVNNKGELENAAGYTLLGWPLDNEGRKPGATGNSNTTPAESTSSLSIVDINSISGTAAATTSIEAGLNLNAGQAVFQGATITLDLQSSNNNTIGQSDIIVPTNTSGASMQEGDELILQAGTGSIKTFVYGGFDQSKIVSATNTIFGASSSSVEFSSGITNGHKFTINTSGTLSAAVTFTYTATSPDTLQQEFNSMDTLATAINNVTGLAARTSNNQLFISSTDANDSVTFANVNSTEIVETLGLSDVGAGGGRRYNSMLGFKTILDGETDLDGTISNPTTGTELAIFAADPQVDLVVTKTHEDVVVNLSSFENGTNNLTSMIIPPAGTTTMVIENTADTDTGSGSAITLSDGTNTGRLVYGGVATSAVVGVGETTDLGLTNAVDALQLTGPASATFTYTTGMTLTTLAAAIDAHASYVARVENGRLYVAEQNTSNANAAVSIGGASTAAMMAALGGDFSAVATPIAAYTDGTSSRFNTLEQFEAIVDGVTNMTATGSGTSATTQVLVEVTDDSQLTIGSVSNSGSGADDLLRELGLQAGAVGDGFFTELELDSIVAASAKTATVAQSYDQTDDSKKNIAGGGITAHFTRNIQVFDSLGTGHDFQLSFLKTGTNEWAVEFYAIDETEVTNGGTDGIVAAGTITFNGDGSLNSVTGTIASSFSVSWDNGAESNTIAFDLGTSGLPASIAGDTQPGLTDGLRQFDSSFNVEFVEQNGVAAGQFNNISIDEDGLVNANFTNGEIKSIFKIPMVIVANDNELRVLSGGVYQTTQASGEANLKDAGSGDAGTFVPFALEASTTDIAKELTETIPTQANYNANLRLITTADEMLDRLTNV